VSAWDLLWASYTPFCSPFCTNCEGTFSTPGTRQSTRMIQYPCPLSQSGSFKGRERNVLTATIAQYEGYHSKNLALLLHLATTSLGLKEITTSGWWAHVLKTTTICNDNNKNHLRAARNKYCLARRSEKWLIVYFFKLWSIIQTHFWFLPFWLKTKEMTFSWKEKGPLLHTQRSLVDNVLSLLLLLFFIVLGFEHRHSTAWVTPPAWWQCD
jgi:hypothetical protein